MIEVSVKVKDEDQRLTKKFIHYNTADGILVVEEQNQILSNMVDETVESFNGVPDDIIVTIKYQWK